jgi:hypothetical protein
MEVFVVLHDHRFESGYVDSKLIGVFSSSDRAYAALNEVRDAPGFDEHPEGFHIDRFEIDKRASL